MPEQCRKNSYGGIFLPARLESLDAFVVAPSDRETLFFSELALPEKWKPYNQAEHLLLSDGYFLEFCKIAKYDHYATGKTTRPDAVCPGCHLPLTRHLHLDLAAPELARLQVPPTNRKSLDFYYCSVC